MAVSTWINMVSMPLERAESSQRGGWTDKGLYFILRYTLKESAPWWNVGLNWLSERRGYELRMALTYLTKQLLLRVDVRLKCASGGLDEGEIQV
jgi:hypothetical protein